MRALIGFFVNTLIFSTVFGAFITVLVFIFLTPIWLVAPIEYPDFVACVLIFGSANAGVALIVGGTYGFHTRKISFRKGRFQRFVLKDFSLIPNLSMANVQICLEKIGYKDFKMTKRGQVDVLECVFSKGIYEFPLSAGGRKFYEEKTLKIELNNSNAELKLEIKPNCWWIPTANTYSTFYYLEVIEKSFLEDHISLRNCP